MMAQNGYWSSLRERACWKARIVELVSAGHIGAHYIYVVLVGLKGKERC